jgi:aminoacrylate hydrolase
MPLAELGDATLHYKVWGEGPPVLGIMGFGVDGRFWSSQVPAVIQTHSFITFDNRGTGRSSRTPASTIDEMASDAVRLLDHLEIEQAVVFGISMGGAIAQRLVLDHPDRVSALILAATFARPLEFMRRQELLGAALVEALGPKGLIDGTLVRMFTPRFFEIGAEAVDRLVRSFLEAPGGQGIADDRTLLSQIEAISKHDALDQLGTITCPTLVLGAKMDMMVPYFASEEIAGAIPGARFESFDTGHAFVVEEMDAVNEVIHDFLAGLPSRS